MCREQLGENHHHRITQNFSTADAIGRLTLNMLMRAEFEREMMLALSLDDPSGPLLALAA